MKTIYRIQNKQGRGPFIPGFSRLWLDKKGRHDHLLKPISEEFKGLKLIESPNVYYGCGCQNIEKLKLWFSPREYRTLLMFDFNAVKLSVNKILYKSDIQCIFRRSKPLFKGVKIIKLYREDK